MEQHQADSHLEFHNQSRSPSIPKIGLVGVCAAGKTTITSLLRTRGLNIKPIAQEHSYVPKMWQIITKPDILIFLEVTYENTILRRKLNWTLEEYEEQLRRLEHANTHADLVIDTNGLTPEQVAQAVLDYLKANQALHSNSPQT